MRQLLRLSDDWALSFNSEQWIVGKANRRPKGCPDEGQITGWRPIAYVVSESRVLMRILDECGAEITPEARVALDGISGPFLPWLMQHKAWG